MHKQKQLQQQHKQQQQQYAGVHEERQDKVFKNVVKSTHILSICTFSSLHCYIDHTASIEIKHSLEVYIQMEFYNRLHFNI